MPRTARPTWSPDTCAGRAWGSVWRLGTGGWQWSPLQVGWQVADVLAVAHSQGVVHRDLKPDNLMLIADPVRRVESGSGFELRIAKLIGAEDRGGAKTDTHAVMGTPCICLRSSAAVPGASMRRRIMYSLGCVLYQALAGRPPFVAEGAGQLIGCPVPDTAVP